jgi:hypothetical protein
VYNTIVFQVQIQGWSAGSGKINTRERIDTIICDEILGRHVLDFRVYDVEGARGKCDIFSNPRSLMPRAGLCRRHA